MSDDSRPTNRLAEASSPYLRLHRHNPVDWYPWGEEALERARREDRPIFLSVGYSTCYWCHVMERESFSEPEIAERMNRDFVNVKLDREERPDLDEIYMAATQILTGHGGWPNSLFLTPSLEPFFAGTYFPPDDRHGRPGFVTVLRSLADAWSNRRADIDEQARSLGEAMRKYLEERGTPAEAPPGGAAAEAALSELERSFDPAWGGFGGAPKFPTPSNLMLLEELAEERPKAAEMLETTLDRMARGGLFDQLGGGFHRYATDAEWNIPHFEKMLYDNGLLLERYARSWARTGDPERARVARETAAFLERELTSPEGAFWSALDAETGGHEGAFYVWTREQLLEALDEESYGFAAPLLGFDGPPFFEGDAWVLHLPRPLGEAAERRRMGREELLAELDPIRARLLEARGRRPRPLTDDKILADWNGLAIAGLAAAGRLLPEPALVERAAVAAEFVLGEMRPGGGPLLHAWRAGRGDIPAFAADYACLIHGLLELDRASGDGRWLEAAAELAAERAERLEDEAGGFYGAAASPDLLFRSKEVFDGATPSANGLAVLGLLELAERTGDAAHRERAAAALSAFAGLVDRLPGGAKTLAIGARRLAAGAASDTPRSQSEPVSASIDWDDAGEAGTRPFRLRLEIAPGWHLTAPGGDPALGRPLEIAAEGGTLDELRMPPGSPLEPVAGGPAVTAYEGRLEVAGVLRPADEGAAVVVRMQPCTEDRCLAPSELRFAPD